MSSLDALLQTAAVWRASESSRANQPAVASGFRALDEKLGGWPIGALIELLAPYEGIHELSILLPALAKLSQDERWIVFLNPPHIPYAPALSRAGVNVARIVVVHARSGAEVLWSMEQCLRAGVCSAVLAWPGVLNEQAIRRAQLAAETGQTLAVYFPPCGIAAQPSPVPYRLRVEPDPEGIRVEILKRRGGGVGAPIRLSLSSLEEAQGHSIARRAWEHQTSQRRGAEDAEGAEESEFEIFPGAFRIELDKPNRALPR
jgi:cell division inhibitor SulA